MSDVLYHTLKSKWYAENVYRYAVDNGENILVIYSLCIIIKVLSLIFEHFKKEL